MLMEFNLEALERQDLNVEAFVKELEGLGSTMIGTAQGKIVKLSSIPNKNDNLFFLPKRGKFKRSFDSIKI